MICYVIAPNYTAFKNFADKNPHLKCEMVVEAHMLRARTVGKIVDLENSWELWNYQEIKEAIDRLLEIPEWASLQDIDPEEENLGIDYAG